MFIRTYSCKTMEQDICKYFNVFPSELHMLFIKINREEQKKNSVDFLISDFIEFNKVKTSIDQVLFFHLSRRLNSIENNKIGINLYDLLSTENEMTNFLKKHYIEFFPVDNRLELIYKNKLVCLSDTESKNVNTLRSRLGHNKTLKDYCFNGFLLKDMLHKNTYSTSLYYGPEFIIALSNFLCKQDIRNDYFEKSTFYCFEYCAPLAEVIFDNKKNINYEEKQRYLLENIIYRLYEYFSSDSLYIIDYSNPIIRLKDNDIMKEEYYISSSKIDNWLRI